MTRSVAAVFVLAGLALAAAAEEDAVAAALDAFHAAASRADEAAYLGAFAPDGVFIGTAPGERWTVEEFRDYARPHFSEGRGWTYIPSNRHVIFSREGNLAWIDEWLDNEKYGRLRGTGVLRLVDGKWKLAHYSMSFTIPNEVTLDAVAVIRAAQGESSR